ncbi:MAG: TMEM175 family protein [Patescibacteria group bacterium]
MDKTRLENLSDGVFAIVLTLLVIEIKVPEFHQVAVSNWDLWWALWDITPLFVSYYLSFIVLTMFWLAHHGLYSLIARNVDRIMILMNFFYLCMIAFIPFSSHLIGTYPNHELAFIIYGLNVLAIGGANLALFKYAIYSREIETSHVTPRVFKQAVFRLTLTPFCTLIGLSIVFLSIPWALFFFAFPIFFNIIPGALNYLERRLPFSLD